MDTPIKLGYINVPRESDGSIRRVPLIIGFRDPIQNNTPVFVPSLALQACLLHLGIHLDSKESGATGMTVDFGKEIRLWNSKRDIHIPIDRHGNLFLNFEGKIEDFLQVPYVDIPIGGEILEAERRNVLGSDPRAKNALARAHKARSRLQNKIALVGLTFTGNGDVGPCAMDSNAAYVFIHMTVVDNILRGSFLRPLNSWQSMLLIVVLSLLVGLLNMSTRAQISAVGTVILLLGTLAAAFLLFYHNIACVPMVMPTLSTLTAFGAISLHRYQVEQKGRAEIRKKFSAMVSGRLLQYMEDHPESLAGEKREATMFFSDVAGFTSISEKLQPEQLSLILNDYLTPMTDLIIARDGYVNKYAGDGIMAVWGLFYPRQDHATQACLSALEQQARIQEIKSMFLQTYGVTLKVRMGLNSGIVSAGNMGSRNRYEYTVMGDAVNFAARLEPSNKDYGTQIMIGEKTRDLAKDHVVTRLLDRIVVQGKTETVVVYELVGEKGAVPSRQIEAIELFEQGLRHYWERDWKRALESFHAVLKIIPDDPPSHVFIHRVRNFQTEPPPANWSGEFVRESKS